MTPYFMLVADGVDITNKIKERLVAITVTDNAGIQNDTLEIELDDRPPYITFPAPGTTLQLVLGYQSHVNAETKYQTSRAMGTYSVDEFESSRDPVRKLKISAKANDTGSSMKGTKTRSWDDTTFGSIMDVIAKEHGYDVVIHPSFVDKKVNHIDQSNQPDQAFLTMLANKNNAVFKVVDNKIYFAPRGNETTIDGKAVPRIQLEEGELTRWNFSSQLRSEHNEVEARTYDDMEAKEILVKTPSTTKNPVKKEMQVSGIIPADEAQDLTDATAGQIERGAETFTMSLIGTPEMRAEMRVEISGLRPGVRSSWLMKTVTHTFTDASYTTDAECEVPKGN